MHRPLLHHAKWQQVRSFQQGLVRCIDRVLRTSGLCVAYDGLLRYAPSQRYHAGRVHHLCPRALLVPPKGDRGLRFEWRELALGSSHVLRESRCLLLLHRNPDGLPAYTPSRRL